MSPIVLTEQRGPIMIVTLNQPDKRNPISEPDMIAALIEAFAAADGDIATRAVILTGAGKTFSAGGDLKSMHAGTGLKSDRPVQTRLNYLNGIQRLPLMFQALEVPVIAAINGAAIGAGCDLACMCDIRIAADSAVFAESFVKLGITPGDGGAWLLPRVIGFPRATEMALTGDTIDAATALAYGLVTQVVPSDQLLDTALAMAGRIAANPPYGVRMTKRLLREGQAATLSTNLEMAAAMQALAHATRDNQEAIEAFIERRTPNFSGE
ncbi:crotonase/enoyl-CoA hydratase family protein [Aquisediminimonas sediminicola]|uniref:crotonase/enoyl-CoA hydratase family protein n=1 Tax=Alteraquisediminimonas sediminicola TaxID=2676787 RepID=UPI003CCEE358